MVLILSYRAFQLCCLWLLYVLFIPVVSDVTLRNSYFCLTDGSLSANSRPARLLPNIANIQDKLTPSSSQLTSRKDRHLYQPESNPSAGIENIANGPTNTPFPFLPPIATFGFPSFWQPLPDIGNYGNSWSLVNRIVRLEEEIRSLKQKIMLIDGVLRCVNVTSHPSCTGFHPVGVSASTFEPTLSAASFPFVTSQTATGEGSGFAVSSTYNRPAGSQGHGTVTVQHFGNRPTA
jgi:hypothetical protein